MKVESYTDFRKLFQLDSLGVLLATRGISTKALCSGGTPSYHPFSLLFPEPVTGPVIA